MVTKTKKKTNKNSITNKVKKAIDKKKKEAKTKKIKSDIKNKIDKGVKIAKNNSKKTLDVLTKVGISAKEKAVVASEELAKASKVAKTSAKKYIDIGKIKAKNLIITNNINKSYEKVGKIVFDEKIDIDNDDIKHLIYDITELKKELKKIQEEKIGE